MLFFWSFFNKQSRSAIFWKKCQVFLVNRSSLFSNHHFVQIQLAGAGKHPPFSSQTCPSSCRGKIWNTVTAGCLFLVKTHTAHTQKTSSTFYSGNAASCSTLTTYLHFMLSHLQWCVSSCILFLLLMSPYCCIALAVITLIIHNCAGKTLLRVKCAASLFTRSNSNPIWSMFCFLLL